MSSRRGGVTRGAPAHQNKTAWKHNPKSSKTAAILASPISGLCQRCHATLEWRKQYRKYKPLTSLKKCVWCEQKTINKAYHVVCDPCAKSKKVCAKCLLERDVVSKDPLTPAQLQALADEEDRMVSGMSERVRRTYIRKTTTGAKEGEEDDDDSEEEDDEQVMTLQMSRVSLPKASVASASSSAEPQKAEEESVIPDDAGDVGADDGEDDDEDLSQDDE